MRIIGARRGRESIYKRGGGFVTLILNPRPGYSQVKLTCGHVKGPGIDEQLAVLISVDLS